MNTKDVVTKHLPMLLDTSWIRCVQDHRINPVSSATLTNAAQDIKAVLEQDNGKEISMRPDVLRFANRMAAMMDIKDQEKGPIPDDYTLNDAMMNLQRQYEKATQVINGIGGMNPLELLNTLIHLANFSMIAANIITKPRQPEGAAVPSVTA